MTVPDSLPTESTYNQNAAPLPLSLAGASYPTYHQDDSTTITETLGGSNTYSAGLNLSLSFGSGLIGLKDSATWSWTDSESVGSFIGQANMLFVTLQSSDDGCATSVSLFEDTLFHTFAFQYPQGGMDNCN
ncbi:MAG: hypothetical protein ACP5E2_11910 [Terracidiphilus sp.]